MKRIATIVTLIVLGLVSCTSQNEQYETEQNERKEVQQKGNKEKIIGQWVQPIPGQEEQVQGIQLNADGTAQSINMHTLIYEKWAIVDDNKLVLWSHAEGVANPSSSIDTLTIDELTDSRLVLDQYGSPIEYKRGQ